MSVNDSVYDSVNDIVKTPKLWESVFLAPALFTVVLFAVALVALSVDNCLWAGSAGAAMHPISVTETSVFVTRTKAIVRIQIFAEDLMLFQGLEPNDQDQISANDLQKGLEAHRQFLLDKVTLRDARGEPFSGAVTDLKPFEIPEAGIAVTDLMLHTATYQLEYAFNEPPEFLTIQQDISDENFIFPSEMRVSVHQSGTDLTFTEALKAGASVSLRFAWDDAPPSEESADSDWEKWFEKQREATLGITSYSSIYSFIYIDPTEIRHEVLIPLATLKTFLPLSHGDPAFVDVSEQEGVRELIREWLRDPNPVTINGSRVMPEFSRIDFYGLDLKDFAKQSEARKVSLASGRVGIIMTYRTPDDAVREATVTWDKFHSAIRKIESVVFAHTSSAQKFEFSRFNKAEDNTLKWQCPEELLPRAVEPVEVLVGEKPTLRIPVISISALAVAVLLWRAGSSGTRPTRAAAAGLVIVSLLTIQLYPVVVAHPFRAVPELPVKEAEVVFRKLHEGEYRALDFGTEDRIYEILATTTDGQLLEDLYVQLKQSLEMREQGGARARVRSIDYVSTDRIDRIGEKPAWPGFPCRAVWTVSGTVEHWGHVHERKNQFSAVFHVEPRDGQWKITQMDIEDQKQVSQKTSLRKF